jgi:hypothetical protein
VKPTFEIDMTDWKKAANDLKNGKGEKRTYTDFINGQTLAVVTEAVKLTEQADRAQIAYMLGQVGTQVRTISKGKRAGRLVRGKSILRDDLENTVAARILTKRFNTTGEWLAEGKTLADRVRRFIGKRIQSVSYIRSGWIPARNKLFSVVRQKPANAKSFAGGRLFKTFSGGAKEARSTLGLITCEAKNSIEGKPDQTRADEVAVKGLQRALDVAAQSMINKLAERMKRDFREEGAR